MQNDCDDEVMDEEDEDWMFKTFKKF